VRAGVGVRAAIGQQVPLNEKRPSSSELQYETRRDETRRDEEKQRQEDEAVRLDGSQCQKGQKRERQGTHRQT
jgi:hypothetical protein